MSTKIQWTDETWNITRGCTIVSPGCTNCYAMKQAHRFSGRAMPYEGLTTLTNGGPVWTGEVRTVPELLERPLSWRKPRRVFVDSMSDLFHPLVADEFIDEVFGVMAVASGAFHGPGDGKPKRGSFSTSDGREVPLRWPNMKRGPHTFQILTKRPERMRTYMAGARKRIAAAAYRHAHDRTAAGVLADGIELGSLWPLPNVWLGVSVEDQQRADERIPLLLDTPAEVRWLSCEPLLGAVDVSPYMGEAVCGSTYRRPGEKFERCDLTGAPCEGLDWIIVGGESGPDARPFETNWARSIVRQCRAAGVPVFVKQLGALVLDRNDAGFEGVDETEWPMGTDVGDSEMLQGALARVHLRDRKGGDPAEWPEALRVREWPA